MIGMWERCPEQFRRRYIENESIPPGIAARIGTGVHKGAEVNHKAKYKTGQDEPLDVVQDAAVQGYKDAIDDGGVFFPITEKSGAKSEIAKGKDTVASLASLYHQSLAPSILPRFVEKKILMDVDDLPVPLSGIIDVLSNTNKREKTDENQDLWLPDIKTAAKKWSQAQADSNIQMTLYNQLVKALTGIYPKKISIEVFTKTKMAAHHQLITERKKEDFNMLIKKIKLMWQTINAGIFAPAQAGSWICSYNYCGYWWSCSHIAEYKKIIPKK
jgi:hypothetical protein